MTKPACLSLNDSQGNAPHSVRTLRSVSRWPSSDRTRFIPPTFVASPDSPLVGVNVSGLLWEDARSGRNAFGLRADYRRLIERVVAALLSDTKATLLIVPHEFGAERELEACSAVLEQARLIDAGRVLMVAGEPDERELKAIIGRTSFFVGSRMHACIAALSQEVPSVGLAYSGKFAGVFNSVGLGETVIDLRTASLEEVTGSVLTALARRTELRATLAQTIPEVKRQVLDTFSSIFETP